jgi:hypothetical protein
MSLIARGWIMCCFFLNVLYSSAQPSKHDLGAVISYGIHGDASGSSSPAFLFIGEYSFGVYYRIQGKGAFDLLGSLQWGTAAYRTRFAEGVYLLQQMDHLRLFAVSELKIGKKHRFLAGLVPRLNFNLQGSVESEDGGFFKRASYRAGLTASEYNPDARMWHVSPLIGWAYSFSNAVSLRLYAEPDLLPLFRSEINLGGVKNVFTFPTPSVFHPTVWRGMVALQFRIGNG